MCLVRRSGAPFDSNVFHETCPALPPGTYLEEELNHTRVGPGGAERRAGEVQRGRLVGARPRRGGRPRREELGRDLEVPAAHRFVEAQRGPARAGVDEPRAGVAPSLEEGPDGDQPPARARPLEAGQVQQPGGRGWGEARCGGLGFGPAPWVPARALRELRQNLQ